MRTRRWTATLIGFTLAVAVVTIGFAGAASAKTPLTVTTHSYVNGSGASKHATVGTLPKKYRALVRRAFARTRTLQGSGAAQTCLGGTKDSDTAAVQTCTVKASAGACIQISNDPAATQTCTFMQSPGRTNLAIVLQIIVQRDFGPSGSQAGSQTAQVTQQNTTNRNLSFVVQIVKQSLGTGADNADSEVSQEAPIESSAEQQGALPNFGSMVTALTNAELQQEGPESPLTPVLGSPVTQRQQSQQIANVCQGGPSDCHSAAGMTGSNLSSVYQSMRQRERAANATSIDQEQNPDPGTCPSTNGGTTNMCALVDQHTTGGKNVSGLAELYRQFQSALNSQSTFQGQDPTPFAHGLDHNIHQESVGPLSGPQRELIMTLQRGRQKQQVQNGGVVNQIQDPVGRKGLGSNQLGSAADTWNGSLVGTQAQLDDGVFSTTGFQQQDLTYDGDSTGSITATVTGTQNGVTTTEQCPGSGSPGSCHVEVFCVNGEIGEAPTALQETTGPSCEGTPNGGGDGGIGLLRR
jgi:hypothetical protein